MFELLSGVGPLDSFGALIVIGNELHERSLKGAGCRKVIELKMLALQQAEPDFELIEPGGVSRQPEHLEVQLPVTGLFLLLQPAFELLRGMGGGSPSLSNFPEKVR